MHLIFITNDPEQARIARFATVDRIMIDLELNDKEARQGHLDTVISRHVPADIDSLRPLLDDGVLMVRVNPLFDGSRAEVDDVIARGADRLMLPMFRGPDEVAVFLDIVAGRVPTTLLLETATAFARLPQILTVPGIDDIHFGLNDLHLELRLGFMFELFRGGLLDYGAGLCREAGVPFGIGGVAPVNGTSSLSPRLVMAELARLGATGVILSRAFRRVMDAGPDSARAAVSELRSCLDDCVKRDDAEIAHDTASFNAKIDKIVADFL